MINLLPMTKADYQVTLGNNIPASAVEKVQAGHWTEAEGKRPGIANDASQVWKKRRSIIELLFRLFQRWCCLDL
jgi:hypothetical protein